MLFGIDMKNDSMTLEAKNDKIYLSVIAYNAPLSGYRAFNHILTAARKRLGGGKGREAAQNTKTVWVKIVSWLHSLKFF